MRINKYLAHEGITTRRGADTLIEKGDVLVNGKPATLGQKIEKDDVVEIKGKKKEYRYLAYYKPRGVITHSPGKGEEDIEMRIKKLYNLSGLFPIGRLDKDSEGLIILTDDGRITAPLLEHGHEREYHVTVDKKITGAFMNKMESGVNIEGYTTKPTTVTRINPNTFSLILTEGKKHQIRRMCAALGYQVERLARVRIMDIKQNALKPGQFRILKNQELRAFLDMLGITP
ncbi:rRNA pseudouridine synthase [Candidatus Kaiserbacteria bacterium]|nr:rRNA pseudouridine synthase [Candidatus Kaiserbacteria bacterium]